MFVRTKEQNIADIEAKIGWISEEMNWPSEVLSARVSEHREKILSKLKEKVSFPYDGNRIVYRGVSPGCRLCGLGQWSCLYVTLDCQNDCFFCPERKRKGLYFKTNTIRFSNVNEYLTYLEKFRFQGVSFSGGEPLLYADFVFTMLKRIKQRKPDMYIWLYTNTHLLNEKTLARLKAAGLNEIRLDLAAVGYDLKKARLSAAFIPVVTAEIPAIPEDFKSLTRILPKMPGAGISFLNVHQIVTSPANYRNFMRRDYTFMHHQNLPILESEMTAYRILDFVVRRRMALPVNLCLQVYQTRMHQLNSRKRLSPHVMFHYEDMTEAGYIRCLSITGSKRDVKTLMQQLLKVDREQRSWAVTDDMTELVVRADTICKLDVENRLTFNLRYYQAIGTDVRDVSGDHKIIRLSGQRRMQVSKELVYLQSGIPISRIRKCMALFGRKHLKKVFELNPTRDSEDIVPFERMLFGRLPIY